MALENGEWILHGADWDSPDRIRSWQELIEYVDAVGFLPLFKNEVEGFSVEEKTSPLFWWTGDPKQDPWEWRAIIARSEKVAYGKFFNKKAGSFRSGGSLILPITGGMDMISTPGGKTGFQDIGVKKSWIFLRCVKSIHPMN